MIGKERKNKISKENEMEKKENDQVIANNIKISKVRGKKEKRRTLTITRRSITGPAR